MSGQQVVLGLLEFFFTLVIGFFLVFATYKVLLKLTPRFDQEKQLHRRNTAVGLALGSILVGEAIIVMQAIYPVMAVVQIYALDSSKDFGALLRTVGLVVGQILLAGLLAVLSILLSFWLFDKLTPGIDEYHEIREGNVAIAVFMALLIVAMSLIVSSGVAALTRALIPFPKIGSVPLT
jgi:putative membrane protein